MKVGNVVLTKNQSKSRAFWTLGRILQLYYGDDNKVRATKVKRGDKQICDYPGNLLYPMETIHSGQNQTSKPLEKIKSNQSTNSKPKDN